MNSRVPCASQIDISSQQGLRDRINRHGEGGGRDC